MEIRDNLRDYIMNDISSTRRTKQYKKLNVFVFWPIRIIIFPIMLLIRLVKWTYNV